MLNNARMALRKVKYGVRFDELHLGGWDPEARMADQTRDGVAAEVIYPTVGMVLCNHTDFDYKRACFRRFLTSQSPQRQLGTTQRTGLEHYRRALALRPGDHRARQAMKALADGTTDGWHFCAD